MTVATTNDSNEKAAQATFLKVGQNLYRNESSSTYYGLTKRGGKQLRTATEEIAPFAAAGEAENSACIWGLTY